MYLLQNMFVFFFFTSFIFLGSNQLKPLLVQFLWSCLIVLFCLLVVLLLFCISMSILISSMLRFIYGKQISRTSLKPDGGVYRSAEAFEISIITSLHQSLQSAVMLNYTNMMLFII